MIKSSNSSDIFLVVLTLLRRDDFIPTMDQYEKLAQLKSELIQTVLSEKRALIESCALKETIDVSVAELNKRSVNRIL